MSQTVHPPRSRPSGDGPRTGARSRPEPQRGTRSMPAGTAAGPAEAGDEPVVSGRDALDWVWRFFISRRTGLVLILVLGGLSLVGTLLEQAPAGVRADPQSYAAWLESVRPTYGGWTGVLNSLGMFRVFSSLWFTGTLMLLATSILACSVHRSPLLWRQARRPRTTRRDAFFDRAQLRGEVPTSLPPAEALQLTRDALRRRRFRTLEPGGGALFGDRFRWAPFGTIAAHVGFVVILLGAFLSASTGFKDSQFTAPVGTRVDVGHGTGLSVEALSFQDVYYANGSPKDYASDLVVYRGDTAVAHQTVRVNQPLSYGGVTFYQSFFGFAADMVVKDPAGTVLTETAVPLAWQSQDGRHTIGQLTIPGQPLTVYVVAPASGEVDPNIQAGQVQLEIYQDSSSGTPAATQVISQGKPATIAGLSYTFARERQYTGLIVARDPGVMLVWAGAALMLGGIFLVFFLPYRRIWVRVKPAGTGSVIRCASQARRDVSFEPRFREFVTDIQQAAQQPGTMGK